VVSCGVRLSEVGQSEFRKPQVVRSIRIAGSIFQSLVLLVPTTSVSVCGGCAGGRLLDFEATAKERFRPNPPWMGKEEAVKRTRFRVEQIVAVLKQADRVTSVADLLRHLGIAAQTFSRWQPCDAGLDSDQVRACQPLQDENATLKRLVADLSVDNVMRQDVLSKQF